MTNRTFLGLGLIAALAAYEPLTAWAQSSMQWSPGAPPRIGGSADEAAQLAKQAAEMAARAAELAAKAQSGSAVVGKPTIQNSASTGIIEVAAQPTASTTANAANNTLVLQPMADIRFQDSPENTANTTPLPPITLTPVPPASVTPAPVVPAPVATPTTQVSDRQVQLLASAYSESALLHATQEEPLPAAPGSEPKASIAPHAYADPLCDDACCPPQRVLFWTAGVEATFLNPDLNSDGVTFQVEEIDDSRNDVFSSQSNDVDSLYMSPRIWLGVQGCAWGANLRYWHLQAGEGTYDPSIGAFGGWDDFDCGAADIGYFTCSQLEAYTVDLEITRRFCLNDCWMQAAVGVRHAEIEHNESITGIALTDEGLLDGFARANRQSRGTGILLGLYGRKPIFPCSCVNWFYNVRWSAVWGPTQTAAETFAAVQSNDPDFTASAASVNGAYTNVDDTLFIGEVQLGLEWNYALVCMPANAFFRVAVEYQRWDGGAGFSAADSFAGITIETEVDPTSIATTTASAAAPQMDLFGFTIGTGLTW
jgi:hypothetical protein